MKDRPAMSTGARTGLMWAFALTTGVLAAGCGSEENVSVGSVNRVHDLGVCPGEGSTCDVPPASADGPDPLAPTDGAASQDPKLCDAEVSGMLAVDFQVDIVGLICSGLAQCNYNVKDFKVDAFDWKSDGFSGHDLAFDDQDNLTIALVKLSECRTMSRSSS